LDFRRNSLIYRSGKLVEREYGERGTYRCFLERDSLLGPGGGSPGLEADIH
jgi:hypothetical protein